MAKHPSEMFGVPHNVHSPKAEEIREAYWCPFADQICNKKSRLISYPMGVCSVQYNNQTVAICPRRFLQGGIVFGDIADHYFGTRSDLLVFPEVSLRGIGSFDFVIVKHKPLSSDVEDFVVVEFQTDQTTGTGKLVQALEDYLREGMFEDKSYSFGLNTYDTLKRSFTQILNKGIVLEQWRQKVYWVFQEPVYQNFTSRYNLEEMRYNPSHTTVFTVYDLARREDQYQLTQARLESSTIDDLFSAFRNNPNVPGKDMFIETLQHKIKAKVELKFRFDD